MNVDVSRLAERAAAGDVNAFGALYDLFFARVYNYARYRCEDDDTADDLTAQIFERLLTKIPRYSLQKGPFEAWLFALVRNVVIDYHRARKLRSFLPWENAERLSSDGISPEDHSIHRDFERQLLCVLPKLNQRERDLLGMKFALGLDNRQIADLAGISEGNVAVILHRAINHLRNLLESYIPTHPRSILKESHYE
jgi:RNA polymerase sigma-70 factor (ECF subfamily)